MVMTVLMRDAVSALDAKTAAAYETGSLSDLLYADDTLLIGVSDDHLQHFLSAIQTAGLRYGMELHIDKFQLLMVQCKAQLKDSFGNVITMKDEMEYLGTILSCNSGPGRELSRRIGIAKAEYGALSKVWKHASLNRERKLAIYNALIESKLLYGMATMCLSVAEQRRINGFQNRCIRQIIGIKPAHVSRISNARVLAEAGKQRATTMHDQRRLALLGKVLRLPEGHPMKLASFIPGTMRPATERYVRRVGRPNKEWVPEVLDIARHCFGSDDYILQAAQCPKAWRALVCNTCPA